MKTLNQIQVSVLSLVALATMTSNALAVGNGTTFGVNEGIVGNSNPHIFQANSVDLSYHACTDVIPPSAVAPQQIQERGYFWLSSYQDDNGVLDSQINYYDTNGYHIYGVYEFNADEVGVAAGPLGNRRGYEMKNARLTLYLDPNKDTNIQLQNCVFNYNSTVDDVRIGYGNSLQVGEKSENDGLPNGDFQFVLDDWTWDVSFPFVPFAPMSKISLNANLTLLGGNNVDQDHKPEGSGNIYWRN